LAGNSAEWKEETKVPRFFSRLVLGVVLAVAASSSGLSITALANHQGSAGLPDFGPNVFIFNPSMPQSSIQATVDAVAAQQVANQFGTQRYALLFAPGTYGSTANPLIFQVGYYTSVAGLGPSPRDVVINGAIDVFNQCGLRNGKPSCIALNNFWRSLSNLTINLTLPKIPPAYSPPSPDPFGPGCDNSAEMWATSQASPIRRVQVNGFVTLFDYCGPDAFSSGGFIADSAFAGSTILNGSQQQFFVRNSNIDGWTNGIWNQVFSGVVGAPAQCFPGATSCGGPYTTLATSPVTREAPFLYADAAGNYNVFVPAVRHDSAGTSWTSGQTPGTSIGLDQFFVATPSDSVQAINRELANGKDLLLTPGVYQLDGAIRVVHRDSVVLGLGFPTLVPQHGDVAMIVVNPAGAEVSGIMFDAGPNTSPALLQVGAGRGQHDAGDAPASLHDVFFRIGGATAGRATTSLVVNSDGAILDDVWAWRADHGNGVGWTSNTADTGVVVNGDNVTAYGLFVEHYQKYEVLWNGEGGTDVFFQNEMPYDPPSQAAWNEAPGVDGWAAFKVGDRVSRFTGYGMGSYSFFNHHVDIFAAHAFEVPASLMPSSLHDLLTIFLDAVNGSGGIRHVINDTGGSSTSANPDTPVTVVSYP
jgi:hypothetical protein